MAVLTPTVIVHGTRTPATIPLFAGTAMGSALTAAEAGGDSFPNNGQTFFRIKNGGGSPITATITRQKASDTGVLEHIVATIPASGDLSFGSFPPGEFNDVNGRVIVTYSAVTTVTVMPYRLSENGR